MTDTSEPNNIIPPVRSSLEERAAEAEHLRTKLERLQQTLAGWKSRWENACAVADGREQEARKLRAEVEQLKELVRTTSEAQKATHEAFKREATLREALRKYGAHLDTCSWDPSRWNDGPTPCDCGLDAALAPAEAKEEK